MLIVNEPLLEEFRTSGRCELCNRWALIREPHHLRCKGFGGADRQDLRINLISLGGSIAKRHAFRRFFCNCHKQAQEHKIPADHVLSIVSIRECVHPSEITEVMDLLRRLLRPTESELRTSLLELSSGAMTLAVKELTEAGKL